MEKEIQVFDAKAISIILGVANIKAIEKRGNLKERLIQKNCRLIEKFKDGRKFMYKVEIIQKESEYSFDEICDRYKIRKKQSFEQHTKNRYYSIKNENNLITQKQFAEKTNEDVRNIRKYDEVLVEEKFMKKDGFRYWVYKDGKMLYETSKESYNKYWANNRVEKQLMNILKEKLNKKEITLEEYSDMYSNIISKLNIKGEIIQRTRNFAKGSEFEKIFNMMNQ